MVPLHFLRIALVSAFFFTAVNGNCSNPKVRKEWRKLASDERASWLKAVNCLSKLPHNPSIAASVDPALSLIPPLTTNSSYYDDFVYTHMDLNVVIHNTGFFLPWHRLFVQTFEDELTSKCGYNGASPYWDWTQDTADFYHSTMWTNDSSEGLGWWGDPNEDYQLFTGALKDFQLAYPVPHRLRRNYTNPTSLDGFFSPLIGAPPVNTAVMFNATFIKEIVDFIVGSFTGDYINFQGTLENFSGPHPGLHLIHGGDMGGTCPFGLEPPECYAGPKWSTNDPVFFLHHASIDKMWYDWQNRDANNKNAFAGGSISFQVNITQLFAQYPNGAPPWLNLSSPIPGDGLWGETLISDVIDTVGGRLCYVYDEP